MQISKCGSEISGRALLVAVASTLTLVLVGCGGSDKARPVASDPATQTPTTGTDTPAPVAGDTTVPAAGDDTVPAGEDTSSAPGGPIVATTSQYCDEGTAGTVPVQEGDPAIDSVAAAVPGAASVTIQGVACSVLGAEGSDPLPATRALSMDRANLQFLVNGAVVASGAEAFRWVDSREYCAKPTPVSLADGTVLEIVAKFRADNNAPTYYRQKSSQPDGSRITQIECIPAPGVTQ